MTVYSINPEEDIVNIANAIRSVNKSNNTYTVSQMAEAISDLGTELAITVDSELNSTSENPVQNKVINTAIEGLNSALNGKTNVVFVSSTDDYTAGTTALETGRVAIIYEAS